VLHNIVEKLIVQAIESDDELIYKALFESADILKFIATNSEKDQNVPGTCKHSFRRGYLGHLTKFANHLEKSTKENVKKYLENKEWKTFKDNVLSKTNENEQKNLGGEDPK